MPSQGVVHVFDARRFMDPRDHRGHMAFGRHGNVAGDGEDQSPEWGQVARQAVAESLARDLPNLLQNGW